MRKTRKHQETQQWMIFNHFDSHEEQEIMKLTQYSRAMKTLMEIIPEYNDLKVGIMHRKNRTLSPSTKSAADIIQNFEKLGKFTIKHFNAM